VRNTKQANCAYQRLQIMEKVHAGQKQYLIAKELGVSSKTIQRAVKKFLESDSKYPAGMDASTVELMRTEEFNSLDDAQAKLALAYAKLPNPVSFDEHCEKIKVTALAAATLVKISERKSALFGLNAVVASGNSPTINNLMIAGGDEIQYLQNLAKLKQLENGHRQQQSISEP
jgi:hypothetical protein